MSLRKRSLPIGWYPQNEKQVRDFLEKIEISEKKSCAVIAPHAGWFYSGKIAGRTIASLDPDVQTIVIIGGHLPAKAPVLFIGEDEVETPLGNLKIDCELRNLFVKEIGSAIPDRYQDNTIEVLLPIVSYFFPRVSIFPVRFPNELSSFERGKVLTELARSLNRKICVIGSTDLTHYGENYGFSPYGKGEKALKWVKEVNDSSFIQAIIDGVPEDILKNAEENLSACSVGAVLGVLGFAKMCLADASLIAYSTSAECDNNVPSSFVGYAGIAYPPARQRA